jgi:hypothetical protein
LEVFTRSGQSLRLTDQATFMATFCAYTISIPSVVYVEPFEAANSDKCVLDREEQYASAIKSLL